MNELLTESQKAALNTEMHISLAANAGSGKTFVLKKRYVDLLKKVDVFPANIAAITFTEKAASELYSKIREQLEDTIANTSLNDTLRRILKSKKRLLSSARISTIHSFCIEILREFALEAEIDPGFTPVDDVLSAEVLETAIDKTLQHTYDDADLREVQTELQLICGGYKTLKSVLKSAVQLRSKLLPYYNEPDDLTEEFQLDKINRYLWDSIKGIAPNLGAESLLYPEIADKKFKELLFSNVITLITPETKKKRTEGSEEDYNSITEVHQKLINFTRSFKKLYLLAIEFYDTAKKELNFLDYDDLILKTRILINQHDNDVSKHLTTKYKFIMIDEYQDTDDAQFDIFVAKLKSLETPQPNLFIVGDEKQSIYMFRNAEPQIFRETRGIIGAINPNGVLTLAESFRMSRTLCAFNNQLFKHIFSNPVTAFNAVKEEELIYARHESEEVTAHIEILVPILTTEQKLTENIKKTLQAELISKRILLLLEEKSVNGWDEIGVLIRTNNDAVPLQRAFEQFRIPHIFSGKTAQFQDQITADILNFLRFLSDYKNNIALAGVLRSPFFFLSDHDIYDIFCSEGYTLWEKLKNYSSMESKQYSNITKLLQRLLIAAREEIPSKLLFEILAETEYIEINSGFTPPESLFSQLRLFADKISSFESEQNYTLFDLISYLEDLQQTKGKQDSVISETDPGTVNIMTLHSAKGLEFKAVFIFNAGYVQKDKSNSNFFYSRNFGVIPKFQTSSLSKGDKKFPLIGRFENSLKKHKEYEELKRLFYVGCTRATDQLFFSADSLENPKENSLIKYIMDSFNLNSEDSKKHINAKVKTLNKVTLKHDIENVDFDIIIRDFLELDEIPHINPNVATGANELQLCTPATLGKYKELSSRMIPVSGILTYKECPNKYRLVHELRINKFLENLDEPNVGSNLTATQPEIIDESVLKGAIYGNIIHKGIEIYRSGMQGSDVIEQLSLEMPLLKNLQPAALNKLAIDFDNIFNSTYFISHHSQKGISEYEITAEFQNHIVAARIDYIIPEEDKVTIVDYKTNTLENFNKETLARYQFQLEIYALMASKLFPDISEFHTLLYITRQPDKSVIKTYKPGDLINVETEVTSILNKIFSSDPPLTTTICTNCLLKNEGLDCATYFTKNN